jgi:hypothetical protein
MGMREPLEEQRGAELEVGGLRLHASRLTQLQMSSSMPSLQHDTSHV